MHVEVDDSDALGPMGGAGVMRANGDVVEQAKTHRHGWLGVMAGRPHRAKGIAALTSHDRIHRGDHRTRRAQSRFTRSRRQAGVAIQAMQPLLRHCIKDARDVRHGMSASDFFGRCARRFTADQRGELRCGQRIQHGFQPRRAFRVARRGFVVEAGGMGEECGGHGGMIKPSAIKAPQMTLIFARAIFAAIERGGT